MKVIIVTGTPATGKTVVAKRLAERLGYRYIDVNSIIDKEKLSKGYDKEKDCRIVDEEALAGSLAKLVDSSEEGLVIDSHLSHYLPKEKVDLCIITTCPLEELNKRLSERSYNYKKLKENLLSEIVEVIKGECEEAGHNIRMIDTSKDIDSQIDDMEILQ